MAEPVTLFDARAHLRIDADEGSHPDDGYIQALISAARSHVEGLTQQTLVQATRDAYFDEFPDDDDPDWEDGIRLPFGPVSSVSFVKYVGTDGVLATLDSAVYRLDSASLRPRLALEYGQCWPSTQEVVNAVQVRAVCGGTVDPALKQAILLLVAHWYENRVPVGSGSQAELPLMVDALLAPHRVWSLA